MCRLFGRNYIFTQRCDNRCHCTFCCQKESAFNSNVNTGSEQFAPRGVKQDEFNPCCERCILHNFCSYNSLQHSYKNCLLKCTKLIQWKGRHIDWTEYKWMLCCLCYSKQKSYSLKQMGSSKEKILPPRPIHLPIHPVIRIQILQRIITLTV